jgi:DNA primase
MRFTPQFLEDLRSRLPVSEVVGRRVKLTKAGREWKGLSPFNKEKTPSFFVNDQKEAWFDFSSGKNGSIFDFIMLTEGVTFPEAVERLAAMAGVALPKYSKEEEEREEKRKTLHDIMELAAKFFETALASREGAKARGYLSDRGIKAATQVEFRIGYAPAARYALKEFLGSQGVSVAEMIEVGLLVAGDDIPIPYDRFRDRITIPIHDQRGRIVGFGGRILDPEGQPKYLNSPETSLFHKGSTVFNFHRARQAAHEDGSVVVVEGYMDAISVYQAGMKSVVATMGTAFTEEQIETLWRLSPEPIVCFDADRAGIGAAHRSIDRILPLLKVGRTFRFAFIQSGKDPDELIRDKGLDVFKEVLLGSLPLWDVLWERETESSMSQSKFDTPDSRAALEHRMNIIVRTIKDQEVYTAYHRTCRIQLSELFWQATKGQRDTSKFAPSGLVKRHLKIEKEGYRHGLQKILLGMLVEYPEFLDEKAEPLERLTFSGELERFRAELYRLLFDYKELDVALIYEKIDGRFYKTLDEIHGDKTDKRPRGYRLFMSFPVLAYAPSHDFIARCIDHFIHILQIQQMVDELGRLQASLGVNDPDADKVTERILALKRDIQTHLALQDMDDMALAEEAIEIKRLGRRPDLPLPSLERVRESA